MTASQPATCGSCGAAVTGRFCSSCGAPAGPRSCAHCHAELSAQARFCHRCGAPVGATAGAASDTGARGNARTPWIVAGAIILVGMGGILALVAKENRPVAPDMANAGNAGPGGAAAAAPAAPFAGAGVPAGRAPDISQMSPKERFARLNDRVMQAAEQGDTTFVGNFTPMALGAYAQLDTVDVDSRYHAAMLHAGVKDYPAALALADTIAAESPGNLFADLIRATVAQAKGDEPGFRRERARFLQHFDSEIAKPRAEYQEHRAVLDGFRKRS
jgi:hypothetical protein